MKNKDISNLHHIQIMKQLNMDVKEGIVNIRIRLIGLLGKNYKVQVKDQNLSISALTWKSSLNKPHDKYSISTSSFFLPFKVEENNILSTVKDGILKIQLQRDQKQKSNWDNNLHQQIGNYAHAS